MPWVNYDKNPILDSGPCASFDESFASWGSILEHKSKLYLYYSGKDAYGKIRIGLAISSNGRDFKKYEMNPILNTGNQGSWDEYFAYCPIVWKTQDENFMMIYTGCDNPKYSNHIQVGFASSSNGLVWEKSECNPIFNISDKRLKNRHGQFETEAWGFYFDTEGYYLLYNSVSKHPRQIFAAFSKDLIKWTRIDSKPLLPSEGKKEELGYMKYCASIFHYDSSFYIASAVSNNSYSKSAIGVWKFDEIHPKSNREFIGYIMEPDDEWNSHELDTPLLRSNNQNDEIDCYYGGRSRYNVWRLGVASGKLKVSQ
ncbi:MAG: hypothetical protein ACFFDQ_10715 [Candidatus Thorarchaeota archaeon]